MRTLSAAIVLLVQGSAVGARAATLLVPSEYPTIQAGIDAAVAGDTVLVAPGVYTDYETRSTGFGTITSMAFLKQDVVLRSELGASVTELHHGPGGPGLSFLWADNLTSGTTAVEGFTATADVPGCAGYGCALSGPVTIRECRFEGVAAGVSSFIGDVVVIDCEFVECGSGTSSGGIVANEGTFLVEGSRFIACRGLGAIHLVGQSASAGYTAEVRGCWFEGNVSTLVPGAGVFVTLYSSAVVDGCTFIGNSSSRVGGAVYLPGDTPNVRVLNSVFLGNSTEFVGGAMEVSGNATVSGCTFHGNHLISPVAGTAISLGPGSPQLQNNVISETGGATAITVSILATVASSCNVFWDNPNGIGIPLSSTDRIADPQFCDAANGDFTVADSSPCLPANSNGCGQIGAFGQGCGAVSVESMSWGRIKAGFRREEGGP